MRILQPLGLSKKSEFLSGVVTVICIHHHHWIALLLSVAWVHVWIHIWMYVCIYLYVYMFICVYMCMLCVCYVCRYTRTSRQIPAAHSDQALGKVRSFVEPL